MSIKVLILALFLTFIPFTGDGESDITPLEVTPFDPSTAQIAPPSFPAMPPPPSPYDHIDIPEELDHMNNLPEELRSANLFFAGYKGYSEVYWNDELGVIYLRGVITPRMLDAVLSIDPEKVNTIDIHSTGGHLEESMMLAVYIRHHKMNTYVRPYGICYSGCTVIFQAGTIRTASTTAQFMYHYPHHIRPLFPEHLQFIEERMLQTSGHRMWNFMQDQGISPEFTDSVTPEKDEFRMAREMMDYNAVNALDDGKWKKAWLERDFEMPFSVN